MPAVQMWALWGIINVCTTNSKHLLISNCLNSPLANKQLRQDDAFDFCKVEHRWKPLFDPIDHADINPNPPPPQYNPFCAGQAGYLEARSIGLVIMYSKQI